MSYDIVWTNAFKKDYKLAMNVICRWIFWMISFVYYRAVNPCRKRTVTMH